MEKLKQHLNHVKGKHTCITYMLQNIPAKLKGTKKKQIFKEGFGWFSR